MCSLSCCFALLVFLISLCVSEGYMGWDGDVLVLSAVALGSSVVLVVSYYLLGLLWLDLV